MKPTKPWFPIQDEAHGCSLAMVWMLFLYGIVLWSPLTAIAGIRWTLLTIIIGLSVFVISYIEKRPPKVWFVALTSANITSAALLAAYWTEPRFLLEPINFITATFLLSQSTFREISKFIDLASKFLIIVLIGAVIGYILAAGGMQPAFKISRPSSAESMEFIYLFGTTMTNMLYDDNTIRPAGIYDEPGALSFVVCLIVFMRHTLKKDYKTNWFMLFLGFITASLAHLVFVFTLLISAPFSPKKMGFILAVVLILIPLIYSTGFEKVLQQRFFWRLAVTETGVLAGDNRSDKLRNAARMISSEGPVFLFGAGPQMTVDPDAFIRENGKMGENPLHPLVARGIFTTWPYYLFLTSSIAALFYGRHNLAYFGVACLFMQRPYLSSFGYSLLGIMAIWLQVRASQNVSKANTGSAPALELKPV